MSDEPAEKEVLAEDGAFDWPDGLWKLVGFTVIASLVAIAIWTNRDEGHYQDLVLDSLWTTYSIGNPATVALGNVRPATSVPGTLCGRINYEKSDNRGWSGYTDFFMENGIIYISPSTGRYAPRFRELCQISAVDYP